ncbi:hypothetical protein GJU43_14090 [Flavobacterium sp. LC2016-23]|uniref:hypothetical protein n=1 Tax=Flavobacterium sp. LC2016-23 TaxID=2666330 RepID=UPI0012B08766|nr:hypothetical protein [Flavobacterium sp. LC2016-23]MRX40414.1 hypothetical protein [Flavobacterium sp. LC2016-23]
MAIVSLTTIKNWFKTGLVPDQNQFWDTWDSFRHKSDQIAVTDISGINGLLASKTEQEVFDNHLQDENAHPNLLLKSRCIPVGQVLFFKVAPNVNENEKEPGDYCMCWIENSFVSGNWTGSNDQLKSSYT